MSIYQNNIFDLLKSYIFTVIWFPVTVDAERKYVLQIYIYGT